MKLKNPKGFTLIEVVMAIVIAGILAGIAMRSTVSITETGRTEITKTEMKDIAFAMVGNADLQNNHIRNEFGYVGDVGTMPTSLADLMTNPGGYATWKGPYVKNRFSQTATDYAQDAWGKSYAFAGVDITSTGSGSTIVHKVGEATSDFLSNKVTGNIYDSDGTPPGTIYKDSITVLLTIPNGSGATITNGVSPNFGGYFSFDSVPIGNHDIQIVYIPTNDTLKRFVSVTPKSVLYDEYLFATNYWTSSTIGGSSGSIIYVAGTIQTEGGSDCDKFNFDITNISGSNITITSITPQWTTSPATYFKEIKFDGDKVFEEENPRAGTGATINFNSSKTINAGQTVNLEIKGFEDAPTSGNDASIGNTDFTITFSDGSVITINTGSCP